MERAVLDLDTEVHRRRNALTGEWVLVSPHRAQRPWQGYREVPTVDAQPVYDPDCYLCPGNARAGPARNPDYPGTFVFDNDFAALRPRQSSAERDPGGLLEARSESGACRVICYAPQHNLTLGQMRPEAIRTVIDTWCEQTADLGASGAFKAVTIFENRGALMGASSPHPHGQVWATQSVPAELDRECTTQQQYLERRGSCLLCDYLALEERSGERLVCTNAHFIAMVPFWAVWPFETLVLPRGHHGSLGSLGGPEREAYADILRQLNRIYDALFQVTFPYTMGVHQCPTDGRNPSSWHLHTHFYPPLLRSASVRKFMVGFELLAGPQRDITPESAAAQLRAVSSAV